jgi:hypothetical protein
LRLTPNGPAPEPRGQNQRIPDSEKNLKPGTLISKSITNPIFEEFVLVAHKTIQVSTIEFISKIFLG